jgi:hypothetical protein
MPLKLLYTYHRNAKHFAISRHSSPTFREGIRWSVEVEQPWFGIKVSHPENFISTFDVQIEN